MNFLRKLPPWTLYVTFSLFILGLLVWSSLRTFRETDTRQASAELPGRGWVTVTFRTVPFPPPVETPVTLTFSPANGRGNAVILGDSLPLAYGLAGSDTPLAETRARWDGGFYGVEVRFPQRGDYWLRLSLEGGKSVRFLLTVP